MNTYSITNIDGFIETVRDGAARSISEKYTENLDDFISIGQIKNFIEEINIGTDDDGLPMITEDIFDDIFDYIRNTIYQVGLSKLAASNHIECAWDDESNQMVFWLDSKTEGQIILSPNPSWIIMTQEQIRNIQTEIDSIREYVETELCKKCEEMFKNLAQLEKLLKEHGSISSTWLANQIG